MRHRPLPTVAPALLFGALLFATAVQAGPEATTNRTKQQALDHYAAGQSALGSERFDEAVLEFRQAISLDPLLVMAHYGLGQAHMALKDYPAAVTAYVGCRKAFHADQGSQLEEESDRDSRLSAQIRAIQDQIATLNNSHPTSNGVRSQNLVFGNMQQQIDTLQAQRGHGPSSAEKTPTWISVALGSAYFRSNAFADAEREYRAALDVDKNLAEAHNNLAVVFLLTNRGVEAEREVTLAERSGFKVQDGLKREIARLRATTPNP